MSNTVADKLAKKTRKKAPAKQVRLKLVYIDFWSSVKFSFLVALCAVVVGVVATLLIYTVLLSTGVLAKLNELMMDIVGDQINLLELLNYGTVVTFAVVGGVLNMIVGTAFGAVGALIYNLLVRVLGGFQLGFTSN